VAYCTLAELKLAKWERILIQLTAPTSTPSAVDESVVTAAIADADAVIDSYLCLRYTVPLTTVPPVVNRLSMDIAIYFLYMRGHDVPDTVENKYNDAVKLLDKMASGKVGLGETTLDPTPSTPSPFGQVDLYDNNKFTMNAFGDSDKT
jgi:phage gp36-like protein